VPVCQMEIYLGSLVVGAFLGCAIAVVSLMGSAAIRNRPIVIMIALAVLFAVLSVVMLASGKVTPDGYGNYFAGFATTLTIVFLAYSFLEQQQSQRFKLEEFQGTIDNTILSSYVDMLRTFEASSRRELEGLIERLREGWAARFGSSAGPLKVEALTDDEATIDYLNGRLRQGDLFLLISLGRIFQYHEVMAELASKTKHKDIMARLLSASLMGNISQLYHKQAELTLDSNA
jgi:hypothetical protein